MGLEDFLLMGDLNYQATKRDRERDMGALRGRLADKTDQDDRQDTKIEALRQENLELRLYVTALVRTMLAKGQLNDEEVRRIARQVTDASPFRQRHGSDPPVGPPPESAGPG